jgi:hypothetical protein
MGNGTRQLDDLNDWLGELPVRHRLITAGNHDAPIATDVEMWRKRLSNATLLINEGGIHVWGSPVTRVDGAFGVPDEAERDTLYSGIPCDPRVDLLITHGPPLGILDVRDLTDVSQEAEFAAGFQALSKTIADVPHPGAISESELSHHGPPDGRAEAFMARSELFRCLNVELVPFLNAWGELREALS